MPARQEEILIVRLAGLGDIATASTILSRIRAEVDEPRLFVGSIVERTMVIAKVWGQLARHRFDVVVIAHADARYRWLVRPIPSSRVRALDRSGRGRTNPVPGRFFGDEFARLLDPPGAEEFRPGYYELADLRQRVITVQLPHDVRDVLRARRIDVVLVPGGARNILRDAPLRLWPTNNYAEVARALISEGLSVAIIGDAGDSWVRPAFEGVAVIDLIGRLDIPQTMRVIAESDVVVSHDTGPMHFARLVRTYLVALFGPTIPRQVIGESGQVRCSGVERVSRANPATTGETLRPARGIVV